MAGKRWEDEVPRAAKGRGTLTERPVALTTEWGQKARMSR